MGGGLASCYAGALRRFSRRLAHEALLAEAEQATGLSDWGGSRWFEEAFRDRFRALCASLEEQAALSEQGRDRAHSRLHTMLCSRLRYIAWRSAEPEVGARSIVAPLVGTGLPRAGTTFLHNLLAQDPGNMTATAADAALPIPPPGADARADDERLELYRRILDFQGYTAPDVVEIHPFAAGAPEECVFLQEGACSTLYGAFFNVPSFAPLAGAAIEQAYTWQRGQMEVLQARRGGERWVLKAPSHLIFWEAMTMAFPDAKIFLNHRDPCKVIPSIASLYMKLRSLYSDHGTDPKALGPELLAAWSTAFDRVAAWRGQHPELAVVDVHYLDLIGDPLGAVARLYEAFGLDLSRRARDRMEQYLDVDHHGKSAKRQYGLSDYGLDEAAIEAAFGRYIDHYGVAREKRT